MKAILEVLRIDVVDIVTASCPEDVGGTGTQCQGDDEC